MSVQPTEEGDARLVVVGGCGEDLAGQGLGRAEDPLVPGGVARVEGLDRRGGRRGDRGERAEQGVGVALLVAGDEVDVVEVVAREHRGPRGESAADGDLRVRVEQAHLDPGDVIGVVGHDLQEGVRGGRDVGGPEVPGETRIERGAEPVEDHRRLRRGQDAVVDATVVVGTLRCTGEVPARHEDRPGPGVLRERELFEIGVGDRVERDLLLGEVVGVHADDECPAHRRGLGGAPRDELTGGGRVEPHVALGGVHRVGDAEAEGPDVVPVGEGRIPVEVRRRTGDVLAPGLRHDVRGGVRGATRQRGGGARGGDRFTEVERRDLALR